MSPPQGAAPAAGLEPRLEGPPRPSIPHAIESGRIVAIGRGLDLTRVEAIGDALMRGGVRVLEITLNSDDAISAIARLARRFEPEELLVGAGTVLDPAAAAGAVSAGARFLVMPHTDPELVRWAAERDIPVFPGAFTPTEIIRAWQAGASAVKLFPASSVGPAFVQDLRGPLPEIPLFPTGGITMDNAPAFLAAGALAIGLGSWLMGDGEPAGLEQRARDAVAAIASVPPAGDRSAP
ncbi:MAG: bifunctional 4-hydroxy-2-oxoglutarate aldolase/2-dehydro-3-deoxy-phosphogluconate aldolase [Chloroflexi bacterium]|nr:bifunctional 4-hydroxy-2-oxoglutarate aldolase/2-dehydro-3-deoxy-phosphogluconate aldolase [Chloroflexota bacterium]